MKHNVRWPAVAGFLFFLLVQCYSVYFRLYNHAGPYGLDDAASYIEQINYFKEYPLANPFASPSPINKVLHPYIYGIAAAVIGISAKAMFHLNFYIGLFLMGLVLWFLQRKVGGSAISITTVMALFAFYEGTGEYHGFGWVVPSFYAIMLFLSSAGLLYYSQRPFLYAAPIIGLLLLTHSTGLYLAGVLIFAMLIEVAWFQRKRRLIWLTLSVLVLFLGVFFLSEYLHGIGVLPTSLSVSFNSYKKIPDVGEHQRSVGFWLRLAEVVGRDVLSAATRYHVVKYFYGIYTPLVVMGLYQAYREWKTPLLSLFIASFVGYLLVAPFVQFPARFFYPLEVLTWLVIAYGIAAAIQTLFDSDYGTLPYGWRRAGYWGLMALSGLFIYNNVCLKVRSNFDDKFYSPRFFDEQAFMEYVRSNSGKQLAVYAMMPNCYLGLEGGHRRLGFQFGPPGEAIAADPDAWVVIGENHRLIDDKHRQTGFRVVLPQGGSIDLSTKGLRPGRYRLELVDSGINGVDSLGVLCGGRRWDDWQRVNDAVWYPDENAFPGFRLPWYWFADRVWPLQKRPMYNKKPVREGFRYVVEFDMTTPVDYVSLQNTGDADYLTGMIRLVDVAAGSDKSWDFYWGDERTLKEDAELVYKGRRHPLLWTDPEGAPGTNYLFRLEHNFKDVKAFSFYTADLN